jgi:hypothetical protein
MEQGVFVYMNLKSLSWLHKPTSSKNKSEKNKLKCSSFAKRTRIP